MRPYVIITIQNVNKDFVYDIEVPTTIPANRLGSDIKETLISYNHSIERLFLKGSLFCIRLDATIPEDLSFSEVGIWSGDIIVIS